MPVTPYRPSSDPLDRFFDNLMGNPSGGYSRGGSLMRAPATDVIERQNEIQVIAEMPGLKRDDIEIDVENNVLSISGEKQEERTEGDEEGTYHLAERRYGRFSRSFVLPRDVDPENIEAQFENGVLTVRIPKSEKARRRRIEIGGGQEDSGQVGTRSSRGGKGNGEGEE